MRARVARRTTTLLPGDIRRSAEPTGFRITVTGTALTATHFHAGPLAQACDQARALIRTYQHTRQENPRMETTAPPTITPAELREATAGATTIVVALTWTQAREALLDEIAPALPVLESWRTMGHETLRLADGSMLSTSTFGDPLRGRTADLVLIVGWPNITPHALDELTPVIAARAGGRIAHLTTQEKTS